MAIRKSKEERGDSPVRNEVTVGIALPRLVFVDDYHEFDELADKLNGIIDKDYGKVKCYEVGFNKGKYVGVLYVGLKPSKQVEEQMLKDAKIKIREDEDN